MGWSSGTGLFENVLKILDKHIYDSRLKKEIISDLIKEFENYDCDNLCELYDTGNRAFDEAYGNLNPDYVNDYWDWQERISNDGTE